MIDRSHLNAAGGKAEGKVLNSFKFLNQGWWDVGEPNGSCIHEKGSGKGIGDMDGFLFLTPVGTNKGLEDVITEWSYLTIYSTWDLNLKIGAKVTLSMHSVLPRSSRELFRVTRAWVLDCANWEVKRVMDFGANIIEPRSSANSSIFNGPIPNIVLFRVLQKTYKKCITIYVLRVSLYKSCTTIENSKHFFFKHSNIFWWNIGPVAL